MNLGLLGVLGLPLELEGVFDPCGVIGEALPWFLKAIMFLACRVLCYACVHGGGDTMEELFSAINSSLSSCEIHVFTFIVFSKLPSQDSSSMNCTSLLIITFLVDGL